MNQQMIEALRGGLAQLPPPAGKAVREYARHLQVESGAFLPSPAGTQADLYYTVFALDLYRALDEPLDAQAARRYLLGFEDGCDLDFVHLCCLARAWAQLDDGEMPTDLRTGLKERIERHRHPDGGFSPRPSRVRRTLYATFLAIYTLEELGAPRERLLDATGDLEAFRCDGGGYGNEIELGLPTTPTTAAAALLQCRLGRQFDAETADWLRQRMTAEGGFAASALTDLGELLSTAVALHALASLGQGPPEEDRLRGRGFVLACRREDGGFGPYPQHGDSDVEYTFYGLMALGHLGNEHGK